mmetsp:Transcript_2479/g.6244  ORF Transcript_2479/g.6244 Transcript_2479/m.6244 type:complete len:281 (+) Transcript_2479:670-1512(+)
MWKRPSQMCSSESSSSESAGNSHCADGSGSRLFSTPVPARPPAGLPGPSAAAASPSPGPPAPSAADTSATAPAAKDAIAAAATFRASATGAAPKNRGASAESLSRPAPLLLPPPRPLLPLLLLLLLPLLLRLLPPMFQVCSSSERAPASRKERSRRRQYRGSAADPNCRCAPLTARELEDIVSRCPRKASKSHCQPSRWMCLAARMGSSANSAQVQHTTLRGVRSAALRQRATSNKPSRRVSGQTSMPFSWSSTPLDPPGAACASSQRPSWLMVSTTSAK